MSEMITMIPVSKLKEHPGNFFRKLDDDELGELAGSIATLGMQHPIVVVQSGDHYTIISGHQRTRAIRTLEWEEAPCIVREFMDAAEAEEALIDSNVQTRSLSPMEMARAIRRKKQLIGNRRGKRTDLDGTLVHNEPKSDVYSELAEAQDVSRVTVVRANKLNELIRPLELMVEKGELTSTAAYEFACLSPEAQQRVYDGIKELTKKVTVAEAKKIREEMSEKVRTAQDAATRNAATIEELTLQLTQSRHTVDELNRDLAVARQKPVGDRSPEDVERIKWLESELNDAKKIVKELNDDLTEKGNEVREKETQIDRLQDEKFALASQLDDAANDEERANLLEEIERRDLEIAVLRDSSVFIGGSIQFAGLVSQIAAYVPLANDAKHLPREGYRQYMTAILHGLQALNELKERVEVLGGGVIIDEQRHQIDFPRAALLSDKQSNRA